MSAVRNPESSWETRIFGGIQQLCLTASHAQLWIVHAVWWASFTLCFLWLLQQRLRQARKHESISSHSPLNLEVQQLRPSWRKMGDLTLCTVVSGSVWWI